MIPSHEPVHCAFLQNDLARPIITLLQKPYHERQAALRPNVIQASLREVCAGTPESFARQL